MVFWVQCKFIADKDKPLVCKNSSVPLYLGIIVLDIATNEYMSTAGVHSSCLTCLGTPGHLLSYCSSLLVHACCYLAHGPEAMEQSNYFKLMEWLLQHG